MSEKDKKQIIIVAVLAAVMVLFWINTIAGLSKRPKSAAVAAKPGVADKETPASSGVSTLTDEFYRKLEASFAGRQAVRDPFAPSLAKGGLSLIGILWNQESPQAVINDQSVKVGDHIGPNKVVAIMPDKVVLNDGTSDFELDLQ